MNERSKFKDKIDKNIMWAISGLRQKVKLVLVYPSSIIVQSNSVSDFRDDQILEFVHRVYQLNIQLPRKAPKSELFKHHISAQKSSRF